MYNLFIIYYHIYFQDNWTPIAELYSTCNKMRPCDNNAAYKRLKMLIVVYFTCNVFFNIFLYTAHLVSLHSILNTVVLSSWI